MLIGQADKLKKYGKIVKPKRHYISRRAGRHAGRQTAFNLWVYLLNAASA